MNDRPDEFTPYWLQTAMPSSGNGEMPGQTVMFPWEYPWPHTAPPAMWPASDPSGSSALPPALRVGTICRQFGSEQPVLAADRHAHGRELRISCIATGRSALGNGRAKVRRRPDGTTRRCRCRMRHNRAKTPVFSGLDAEQLGSSSPSLWSTPAGADAQFPRAPLPDDPNHAGDAYYEASSPARWRSQDRYVGAPARGHDDDDTVCAVVDISVGAAAEQLDPSSPSLWSTPAGADAQFPRAPLPDDPSTRATLSIKNSVRPDRGRKSDTLEDMAMTIPSGLARGSAATLGTGADLREMALGAGKRLAGELGYEPSPEQMERIRYEVRRLLMTTPVGVLAAGPTSEQMVKAVEGVTGPLYHPHTVGGKFVNSAAELVPGAAVGGLAAGGLRAVLGHIVRGGIIPGFTSEMAGQLTEGTAAEPFARFLAGLAGYGAATAAHAGQAAGGWVDKARKAGTEFLQEAPALGLHLYHQAHEAWERRKLQAEHDQEQEQLRRGGGGGGW